MNAWHIGILNLANLEEIRKRRPFSVYERMLWVESLMARDRGSETAEREYAEQSRQIHMRFHAHRDSVLWDDNPEQREEPDIDGVDDARASAALNARRVAALVKSKRAQSQIVLRFPDDPHWLVGGRR